MKYNMREVNGMFSGKQVRMPILSYYLDQCWKHLSSCILFHQLPGTIRLKLANNKWSLLFSFIVLVLQAAANSFFVFFKQYSNFETMIEWKNENKIWDKNIQKTTQKIMKTKRKSQAIKLLKELNKCLYSHASIA